MDMQSNNDFHENARNTEDNYRNSSHTKNKGSQLLLPKHKANQSKILEMYVKSRTHVENL